MADQLTVLSGNLDDKIAVLECIRDYNINQREMLSCEDFEPSDFDDALDEKENLIQKLQALDDGFDALYKGVAEQVQGNEELYAEQIKEIKDKIARINALSAEISLHEAANKELITGQFDKMKIGIKQSRQGSKVAYDYYRNMTGGAYGTNQILDSKF